MVRFMTASSTTRTAADVSAVEASQSSKPCGTVIWLHGLGADGHDFEPIVPELRLAADMPLRFIFPHAPVRPVTINGGMEMRAWYDIMSLDQEGRADESGIVESTAMIEALIEREIDRGIESRRIVIAGFSQGGAVAINTVMRSSRDLAGLMALSTYLAIPAAVDATSMRKDLPIFMAHGSFDPVLPMEWGQQSAARIAAAGFDVKWHDYPMAHAVCPDEISAIGAWLTSVFD